MDGAVEARQRKGSLQQPQHPGKAVGPPDVVYESAVDETAWLEVWGGARQYGDGDDNEACQRPDEGPLGEVRQQPVGEGVDEEGGQGVGDVDEELLPRLGLEFGMRKRDNLDDERAAHQASRGRQGHPGADVDPSGGEAHGAPR